MRTLRIAPLALLALAVTTVASAQVVRVTGTVRDETGRPIKGATITAENPDQAPRTFTASTDDKGRWGILGMRRGSWTFAVRAPGYEAASFTSVVVATLPNPPLDVRLIKTSTSPPPPLAGITASDIQSRLTLAEDRIASNDLDGAIHVYKDLIRRVPALTSIYLQIGALYERKSEPHRALEAYQQLADIDPTNARARAAIDRLTRR